LRISVQIPLVARLSSAATVTAKSDSNPVAQTLGRIADDLRQQITETAIDPAANLTSAQVVSSVLKDLAASEPTSLLSTLVTDTSYAFNHRQLLANLLL
jgi:hypothetical protein